MIATSTMNRASQTQSILDGNSTEMTVLERQHWKQQRKYFEDTHFNVSQFPSSSINNESLLRMKTDPEFQNGFLSMESADMNCTISRTFSCPPVAGLTEKLASSVGRESFKKRKAEKSFGVEDKRIKGEVEEVACNRETSADISKEKSKVSEVQKTDYIHVRARRGQATDSHSLAERVRREKISERMRYLQDLVPGCNKIIGKAGMLDEIINYVQSLQSQVEFLSMKLANVNPRIDRNIDNFLANEMFQSCADSFQTVGMLSEVINPPYYQFNPVQQVVSCGGLDMEINHTEMSLERTTSSPVSIAEEFLDSSCFPQAQPPTWENDLQSLYNIGLRSQERSTAFPSEPFTGNQASSNLKMEI